MAIPCGSLPNPSSVILTRQGWLVTINFSYQTTYGVSRNVPSFSEKRPLKAPSLSWACQRGVDGQTLAIWQHVSSAQGCGFWPFSDEVNRHLNKTGVMVAVSHVLLHSPLPLQSLLLPINRTNSSSDLFYFLWSEKLNYKKLMDLKIWLIFQVPRNRVEDTLSSFGNS